jgi:hypothetical protein
MALTIRMKLDDETHELDLSSMMISEARLLKKFTGWDYLSWRTQLGQSDPDAVAFAWWIALRRDGVDPGPFADLDFDMASLKAKAILDEDDAAAEEDADADLPTSSDEESEQSLT